MPQLHLGILAKNGCTPWYIEADDEYNVTSSHRDAQSRPQKKIEISPGRMSR